jgi:hypothetical protein
MREAGRRRRAPRAREAEVGVMTVEKEVEARAVTETAVGMEPGIERVMEKARETVTDASAVAVVVEREIGIETVIETTRGEAGVGIDRGLVTADAGAGADRALIKFFSCLWRGF